MLPIKETVSDFIIRRGNRRILVSQAHPWQMGCGDWRHVKRGYCVSTVREMIPTRKRKRWIYGRWGRRTREKTPIIARCLHNDTPLRNNTRPEQLPQKPTNSPWCHPEALRGQPQPVLLCVSTARCKLHHHLVSIQRGKPTHWSRAEAAALTFGYDEYIFLFALLIRYRSCYAPIHTPC